MNRRSPCLLLLSLCLALAAPGCGDDDDAPTPPVDAGGADLASDDAGGDADAGGDSDAGGATCASPGTPTTPTPPTVASATSDFNVTLRDCTRTSVALACEVGVEHAYSETISGGFRVITANGIVNHDIGTFPNPDNPNTITAQTYSYRVPLVPSGTGRESTHFGIAFSGSIFDPGTAEIWNANTTWRYEALRYGTAPDYFASDTTMHPSGLGVDCNFAHVQPTGAYHYHGVPTAMVPAASALTQIGWAADGAPVFARYGHSVATDASSPLVELRASYRLKSGARPAGAPAGNYDGTFGSDWEYVAGLGDLDACNGRVGVVPVDGAMVSTYHYVLTHTYPYIPRCWTFAPDASFDVMMGGGMMMGGGPAACTPMMTTRCCGDGVCGGPETATNCAADCP